MYAVTMQAVVIANFLSKNESFMLNVLIKSFFYSIYINVIDNDLSCFSIKI